MQRQQTQTNHDFEPVPTKERTPLRLPQLPRPGKIGEERRKERSEFSAQALNLALSGAANRSDLDIVLIADDFGLLVSSNDTHLDLEMLAAVTPIVARGQAVATVKRAGQPKELSVRTIEVFGETLYVAALGGMRNQRQHGVLSGAAAAERILA